MEQDEYTVLIHNLPHTFLLTPEQAAARGLSDDDKVKRPEQKQAPAPKNKARTASTK